MKPVPPLEVLQDSGRDHGWHTPSESGHGDTLVVDTTRLRAENLPGWLGTAAYRCDSDTWEEALNIDDPNPFAAALVENIERLKPDYEIVLGLHGRQSAKKELLQAAGKLN